MSDYLRKGWQGAGHSAMWGIEKLVSELALPAAIVSATVKGNFHERVFGGFAKTASGVYDVAHAYALNAGVRDAINSAALGVMKGIGNLGDNLQNNPHETLYAAIATYATLKIAPMISRAVRKKEWPLQRYFSSHQNPTP